MNQDLDGIKTLMSFCDSLIASSEAECRSDIERYNSLAETNDESYTRSRWERHYKSIAYIVRQRNQIIDLLTERERLSHNVSVRMKDGKCKVCKGTGEWPDKMGVKFQCADCKGSGVSDTNTPSPNLAEAGAL
jgi:excinuclease UvrABC ATPase subunit